MSVNTMIDHLKNGNNVKATKEFETLMADKITNALDAKKVELASTLVQRKTEKEEE